MVQWRFQVVGYDLIAHQLHFWDGQPTAIAVNSYCFDVKLCDESDAR
jgi:hypothetical protein